MRVPVILSGGAGTRLWPVSREGHPKPFMPLPDGQSLLIKTFQRAAELVAAGGEIATVTNRDYYFQSKDHFLAAKLPASASSTRCTCPSSGRAMSANWPALALSVTCAWAGSRRNSACKREIVSSLVVTVITSALLRKGIRFAWGHGMKAL